MYQQKIKEVEMDNLVIKIVDGAPVDHPITWSSLVLIHPEATADTLKKLGYAKFCKHEKYPDTPTHTYESAGFSMDTYGVVWESFTAVVRDTPDSLMAAQNVRNRRNAALAQTDWVATKASETSTAVSADMATYRENLRNITDHANFPFLEETDWPVKP
jgi:hypothetical protein